MTGIIVAFPKLDDGKSIKNLLVRNGYGVTAVCTTGIQAVGHAGSLNSSIVVCGYKFPDMVYSELHLCLPAGCEMLLLASPHILADCMDNGIVCLSMPLKVYDLVNTIDMMLQAARRRKKQMKAKPRVRNTEEAELIKKAKYLLMERNNMTEEEAYRYIQKCSMDSGTDMAGTAEMVLAIMKVM